MIVVDVNSVGVQATAPVTMFVGSVERLGTQLVPTCAAVNVRTAPSADPELGDTVTPEVRGVFVVIGTIEPALLAAFVELPQVTQG